MNVLRAMLVVSLVSVFASSCGGGSKEDPVALCKQGCNKYVDLCASSLPGGLDAATFKAFCETGCTSNMGGGEKCKNESAIIAAAKPCLSKTSCDALMTCTANVPDCETGGATGTGGASGTGTGGASGTGTGGRSGTGTGGASGGGATCADVLACCNAATNPTIKMACMMNYEDIKNAGDATCAAYLTPQVKSLLCP